MVCFVRHTQVNVPRGICYGQFNAGLADSFLQEAAVVKQKIDALHFNKVYTSPLDRCVKLAEYCGYPNAIQSEALMELNFGNWENKKWDDLDMRVWETDWVNNPPPNGESFAEMYRRVANFLATLDCEQHTLIFTHKGVINCAKSYYRGIDLKDTFNETLDYGAVIVFNK